MANVKESKHSTKLRFATVGIINTTVDFGLLFILKSLGVNVLHANTLSSTVAFILSFNLNRKYTFHSQNKNIAKQLLLFISVTLFGLWVIQNIMIFFTINILNTLNLESSLTLFIAKLLATFASLLWNYVLYKKLVFKH